LVSTPTASAIGISRRTLARFIAAGELPTIKIGRRRLIRWETLTAWLSARETLSNGDQFAPKNKAQNVGLSHCYARDF
jgi:excisionase family DNA binding protein